MSFANVVSLEPHAAAGPGGIDRVLQALRQHLNMDVAFISQFREQDRVFTHVDSEGPGPLKAGDCLPMKTGYCQKVVAGELPQLIPDTAVFPVAMAIPETLSLPIGAHMSVPIHLSDGRLYGTLCCFAYKADHSLTDRDLQMMKVFAELISERLESDLRGLSERLRKHRFISDALVGSRMSIVYQPIFDVENGRLCGWECLSRFSGEPSRSPDLWFKEATEAGLGRQMEVRAIETALVGLASLPVDSYLALNCSPQMFLGDGLAELFEPYPADRLVLEVTEHAIVADYASLVQAMAPLRKRGLRIAIDDAGAGYASMRHIIKLNPDIIKLDMSLTQGIDHDPQRRALASALIAFARETGCGIVAEGVECVAELEMLKHLGADKVQGFLLGRPMVLADAIQLVAERQRSGAQVYQMAPVATHH
ncbi:EAL domain-containing protein [Pseudomonas typographi]|uniref:EAL domain-containing protein n=1 Tax=Pseudomonas typographi TaxID=2715964 RepID=A0ABR7Z8E9_9PSED|nr:EAL domain-containing protein [Pseudomonas typographi]MBD1553904.1 EAL domain-containing protein [Pseudomonas typographi]MBD1601739.1 EAL domain-containing protein [Pseudomonas typographi]